MKIRIDLVTIIVLFLILVGMKALGWVTWSWTWVLCPLWIPALLIAAFILIIFIYTIIRVLFDVFKYKWEKNHELLRRKDGEK